MRRKARSLSLSYYTKPVVNPQYEYYRQLYNIVAQNYTEESEPIKINKKVNKEPKRESIQQILKNAGWQTDYSLNPNEFANAGTPINEYQELSAFLPEELAKSSAVRSKAVREAKKALPSTATQSEIDQLATLIQDNDFIDAVASVKSKSNLHSDNVYKQLAKDIKDLENWRIFVDPIKRAQELGYTDKYGLYHPGKLNMITGEMQKELESRANKIPDDYYNTVSAMFSNLSPVASIDNTQLGMGSNQIKLPSNEDYVKDAISGFLIGRKEVRIQNYQGKIVRGKEFSNMADNVLKLSDIYERLDQIQPELLSYVDAHKNGRMTEDLLNDEQNLLEEKRKLEEEARSLNNFVDILGSYESAQIAKGTKLYTKDGRPTRPSILGIPLDLKRPRDFTQAILSKLDDIGAGTDIGIHHMLSGYGEIIDEMRKLRQEGYLNDPIKVKKMELLRQQLNNLLTGYKDYIKEKQEQWSKDASDETDDLDYIRKSMNTSDVFLANQQLAQLKMDMTDVRTLMFAMPPQLGSSNASLMLSLGSMATKVTAALLAPEGTLGMAVIGAGIVSGSLLDIANASWENNAETAEGYQRKVEKDFHNAGIYKDVIAELRSKIKNSENMKDEDLLRRLYNDEVSLNNIKANEILAENVFGSNTIFQYDMGETARGAYRESFIQLAPVGPIAKILKYTGKGAIYHTANTLNKLAGRGELVVTTNAERLVGEAAQNASIFAKMKANMVAFATSTPKLLLDSETIGKTILGFGIRTNLNTVGEGIEEGVQHVRQQLFVNGEFGPSVNMGLFKPIISDMILGSRLGYEWLTGNDAGSGYISDSRMFSEMRGGALGALFQSTPVTVVSTIKGVKSELKANSLVADMFATDKMTQRDRIEKVKQYLKSSSAVRYQEMMDKFDKFIQINKAKTEAAKKIGSDNVGIAEEFIEDLRDLYKKAIMWKNNQVLNTLYKNNGINPGSDEYNLDIAIIIDQAERLREDNKQLKENESAILTKEAELRQLMETQELKNTMLQLSSEYTPDETEEIPIEQYDPIHQRRVSRLLAALEIVKQYSEIETQRLAENKEPVQFAIKKLAESIIKVLNKQLGTNIQNIDEFMSTFGIVDDEMKNLQRLNIILSSEKEIAKATLNSLLRPTTAIATIKKLSKQYDKSIKEDEELLQKIQDDYANTIDRKKKIAEYEINEGNNVYFDRKGLKSIVIYENGIPVKYKYDDENNEPYGKPEFFDKEEYYESREIQDAAPKQNVTVPNMINLYEQSADTPVEDAVYPYIENYYDDLDNTKDTPISKELSEILFNEFLDRFETDSKWAIRGLIKKSARGIVKHNLRGKLDKFGRNIAQRISLLHNNGYTFLHINENYYAVKGPARVKLNRTEALFGQFLQEKYGTSPIEREEGIIQSMDAIVDLVNPNISENQKLKEYKPNPIQEAIKNVLKQKANTDKATLVGRNGYNYFFRTDNGEIVMYTRLHAEIGSQKDDTLLEKDKKDEISKELRKLWSNKVELKKYIESLLEKWNRNLAQQVGESSNIYNKHKLDLSLYTTPKMLEDQNIISAIAELTKGLRDDHVVFVDGPWATVGNIIDELNRLILDGRTVKYDDIIMIGEDPIIIQDVMSKLTFDKAIEQIKSFKNWLIQNKLTPVTDRVLLHSQLKNGHRVAGETDLIAIDEDGNLILFDFKTSKYDFDDSYDTIKEGYNWSNKTQHSRQLTGYEYIINEEFLYKYPVKRRIIVPFTVLYNHVQGVLDKIEDVELLKLIELQTDDSLSKWLTETINVEDIKQQVNDFEETVNVWKQNISTQFPQASDLIELVSQQIKLLIDDLKEHAKQLTDSSLQTDIETVTSSLYNLSSSFEQMTSAVDEEIQKILEEEQDGLTGGFNDGQHHPLQFSSLEELDAYYEDFENYPNSPYVEDMDDEGYLEHLRNDAPREKGAPAPRRPQGRNLEDVAADMTTSNFGSGRLLGPSGEGGGINVGPAAPIETSEGTKSIQDAPDYSNQPPINFEANHKERGEGGYRYYNVAHRNGVQGKFGEEAAKPDALEKMRVVLIPETIERGLKGLFLATRATINEISSILNFYWATEPRMVENEDGTITTVDIAQRLKDKIKQLMLAYPGATIVATKLSRTNGKFIFGEKLKNLSDSVLLTDDEQLLTLLDDRVIGVSDELSIQPISRASTSRSIYSFTSGISVTPGIVTWLYKAYKKEDGTYNTVPIPLTHKRLANDDIDLIINILKKARNTDLRQEFRKIKIGNRIVTSPLSDLNILDILIRFGSITRTTNQNNNFIFDFVRDNQGQVDKTRIEISGIGADRNQLYEVDLDNENDVKKLKERLRVSGFVYANNVNMLMHNLDENVDTTSSKPFGHISNFFRASENSKIKLVKISSSIVFDRKDVDFHEDGSFVALSGAGWVVRHGLVLTQFEKLVNPRISIEDVDIDDTEKRIIDEEVQKLQETAEPQETTVLQQPSESGQNLAVFELFEAMFDQNSNSDGIPFKKQTQVPTNFINIESAVRRIKRMLGKHVDVEIVNGVIKIFEQGKAWAVGACKKDAIVLSTLAEPGTEYHETFHRVMELLLPPMMRRKLHEHYIKVYNNGIEISERLSGERLADMFMNFVTGLPDIYFSDGILKGFNRILEWINAWRKIDDFTLATTYAYIYSGLAKFNSVSKKSSENFDRIWGDAAYFTVNAADQEIHLKEFVNNVHLRDGIRFVTYLILQGYNIDSLGSNLSDLDIRMEKIKQKQWYKIAVGDGAENKSPLQKQLSEIFDHWGSMQKLVVEELKRLSIGGKVDRNNKKDEDLQSPDPSVIYTDIDGHLDEFYRYDRKLDLDTSLKIFLSTIPNLRYSTRFDLKWETNENGEFVDKNGKVTTDPSKYVRRTKKLEDGTIVPIGTVDSLTIPIKDSKGKEIGKRRTTVSVSTNSLGVQEFMDFDQVYSMLITNLLSALTVDEMIKRLIVLGKDNPMFRTVAYNMYMWNRQSIVKYLDEKEVVKIGDMRLNPEDYDIITDEYGYKHIVYSHDTDEGKKGHVIKNAYFVVDVDKEALVTRMFQSFRSLRLKFVFVYSEEETEKTSGKKTGRFKYKNRLTNNSHDARIYPRQWFENLRNGLTDIFEIVGDTIKIKNGKEKIFMNIASQLSTLINDMSSGNTNIISINYNGKKLTLSKRNASDVDIIEEYFVSLLNQIGIEIDKAVLDHYLIKTYGHLNNNTDRLIEMFSSRSKQSSFNSFIKMLNVILSIVDHKNYNRLLQDSKENSFYKTEVAGMYLYADNAFIKELGTAYGSYRLSTNEFMTLGPENTKMYTMAQNHSASEFTDDFNNAVVDKDGNITGSKMLPDMMKFVHNYIRTKEGDHIGSIIIKHFLKENRRNLELDTFIGTKRDDAHDGGTKYSKISKRDDYLSKLTILQNGGLLFPTLSDKSTWFYITGLMMPGHIYENGKVTGIHPRFGRGGRIVFTVNDDIGNYESNPILDQFLEYAECEFAAVKKAINELKTLQDKEKSEKNPGRKLEIQHQIKNYHTKNQAAKFSFLLGVYTESATDKNYMYKGEKERFISFNFNKKFNKETRQYEDATLEDCLEVAKKYFFNKPIHERRSLIANILQHRLDDELLWCVDNGIIEKVKGMDNVPYAQYKNKLLDYEVIDVIKKDYAAIKNKNNKRFDTFVSAGALESWAIVSYLLDINNKSIMSTEEVMRLYTGIPNFFKWQYGDDGVLVDLHSDMVKRLGGLGSTGDTNRLDIPNIPREYTVAEIKDWEIKSEIFEAYKEGFIDNEYRLMVFQQQLENQYSELQKLSEEDQVIARRKIWKNIQDADLELIKQIADDRTKRIVEANAKAETKSFEKGINVADGTAFISPEMTLNLLRERGAYTSKVQKAFEYLMGMDTGSDQLSNHDAYKTIFDALISTQKYSAFGYRMEGDIPVHYYNKFALFPLFKSMAYGFTLDLYNQMQKDEVDMVMFDSAVKSGSEGAQNFHPDTFRRSNDESDENNWNHDSDGNRTSMKPDIRDFKFNVYKQEYKFIRRQLNTDPREDEKMHIGTQMLKITLSNLIKEAIYKTSRGEVYGTDLRNDIMKCQRILAERGANEIKEKLFTDDKIDINKLSKFLKQELKLRGADENTLRQLDVVDGKLRTPLEAMSSIAWIESILISYINKQVIDVNLPGNAFYQRTPFGIEGSPIRVISDEVLENIKDKQGLEKLIAKAKKQFLIYSGRTLKPINNDGSMDCIISIDYFLNQKGLIPDEYRNNYWAIRNYLKKNNIIGKNAPALIIGYRIPTQAESSVHALRVVDVLPVVRDTIILPKDFTKTTGSDFDIDKLYLNSFNLQRKEKDNTITRDFDESDDRYWQNRLLDNYMTLLKDGGYLDNDGVYHKGRSLLFLHRSIDNDTSLVKNGDGTDPIAVYNRIFGNQNKKPEYPFSYQSLHSQVDIKTQFLGGKFGIGPFALANNAQILTMLYDVEFRSNPGSIINELGMISLHDRNDKNGNSILAWLSAMINANVDVAKDPYISALNVNPYTYGLVNLMLRTGMGDQTFMFACQPILIEAAKAFDMSSGSLVEDPSKSKTARLENAVRERVNDLLSDLGSSYKDMIDTVLSQGRIGKAEHQKELNDKIAKVAKLLFGIENGKYTNEFYLWDGSTNSVSSAPVVGRTILEDILVNAEARINPDEPISMENLQTSPYYAIKIDDEWEPFSAKEVLLYVIAAMYSMKPYIEALENVVKYTKIDTKKHGSSWSDQLDYQDAFDELFVEDTESEYFTKSLNDMLENSFLKPKTDTAINLLKEILQELAIQYKTGFRTLQYIILDYIKNHTDDAKTKVSRMILGQIKGIFFEHYMKENSISPKDLFIGNASIQTRLSKIKYAIKNDVSGTYYDYGSNGVITNSLLNALESVPYVRTSKQPMFVRLNRAMVDDADMVNDIINSWKYMLQDDQHPDILKFANDLIVYAFLTSADTNGFTKFFKYVPLEWKEESGYNKFMTRVKNLTDDEFLHIFGDINCIKSIILNNWFDNTIMPTTNYITKASMNGKRFFGNLIKTNNPILKKSNIYNIMGAVYKNIKTGAWQSSINADNAPLYIKVRRQNASYDEDSKYLVYELFDFGKKQNGNQTVIYPIYKLVKPLGISITATGSSFNIYEYGEDIGFEYSISNITDEMEQVSSIFSQTVLNLKDFILTNPGAVLSENKGIRNLKSVQGKEYTELVIDIATNTENNAVINLNAIGISETDADKIEKEGKKIKDICNGKV